VWVDEAYLPYVHGGVSMKPLAARDARFVVCQSLSKSLALSGLRVAYVTAAPETCARIRDRTPPWCVSTPATLAALAALRDPDYYARRYSETRALRSGLAAGLRDLGLGRVTESPANWLCLDCERGAGPVLEACRERGVLLRGGEGMFAAPPAGFVRAAVRSRDENERTLAALRAAVGVRHKYGDSAKTGRG
jgi:histidinol-phosphate/aromatic aminotransferase/cobyric acid decarboxylase-like protein